MGGHKLNLNFGNQIYTTFRSLINFIVCLSSHHDQVVIIENQITYISIVKLEIPLKLRILGTGGS